MDAAFSHCVDAVCETQASKAAEVAPELQLIKASVAFGLYVKKSAPELKAVVQRALAGFLNRRVGSWVAQHGGWVRKVFNMDQFLINSFIRPLWFFVV